MILLTPDLTTIGRTLNTPPASKVALEYAPFSNSLGEEKIEDSTIVHITQKDITLPSFSQPIVYKGSTLMSTSEYTIFVDQRPFTNNKSEDDLVVTNAREYSLNRLKALFMAMWLNDKQSDLKSDTIIAGISFVNVISSAITSHYRLDPGQQLRIKGIVTAYYSNLFRDTPPTDLGLSKDLVNLAGMKSTSDVLDLDLKFEPNITSLVNVIKENVDSIKLENFNIGILLTILNGITYGHNHKELIGISMEYPPLWIAMTAMSITDRSFKNTFLAKTAMAFNKRGVGDPLTKLIQQLNKT